MANYKKISTAQEPRTELHDALGLTGAEIGINNFPAGAGVPFVHSHNQNEEIYFVVAGAGKERGDARGVGWRGGCGLRILSWEWATTPPSSSSIRSGMPWIKTTIFTPIPTYTSGRFSASVHLAKRIIAPR